MLNVRMLTEAVVAEQHREVRELFDLILGQRTSYHGAQAHENLD